MPHALSFRSDDGSAHLEGFPIRIVGGVSKDDVATAFKPLYRSTVDHRNGYEWLTFDGATFGGEACSLSLCFHEGKLTELHLGVALPGAATECGWPTREAIDDEIRFVRGELARSFGRGFRTGHERFAWGTAWADFDARGFQASAGVRYGDWACAESRARRMK